MNRALKKTLVPLTVAVCVCLLSTPAAAQSTKSAVSRNHAGVTVGETEYPTLSATIHIPQQKDLHVDISLECGLVTATQVKTKGGDRNRESASATVQVWVDVFDSSGASVLGSNGAYPSVYPAPSAPVTFCHREQVLEAKLQGIIENIQCFDELEYDLDGNVTGGGDFDPTNDGCVLTDEEVALYLSTMNANAFNFVVENLDSGTYTVRAYVEGDFNNSNDDAECQGLPTLEEGINTCSAVVIGRGSMVLDEIRLGNDH